MFKIECGGAGIERHVFGFVKNVPPFHAELYLIAQRQISVFQFTSSGSVVWIRSVLKFSIPKFGIIMWSGWGIGVCLYIHHVHFEV